MAHRTQIALLALPVMLSMQSCCTLFGLFGCGTGIPITKVSWDSPADARTTLLAGIRASDAKVIYEALSEGFKEANGIDGLAFSVAWEKLRAQIPGLHLAGDATIVEQGPPIDKAGRVRDDRYRYLLEAHGYRFEVEFGSYPYWDVGIQAEDADQVRVIGSYVDSLDDAVDASPAKGALNTRIKSGELVGLTREDFRYVKIGRAWKVRTLQRADE